MKRNSFLHVFKSATLVIIALITMTVFLHSRMKVSLNGIAELSLTAARLTVFYKQRDFYLYPAWTYAISAAILKILQFLLDAFLWTVVTYFSIGYSPEIQRFLGQFFLRFLLHQVSISMLRLIAVVVRNLLVAFATGAFCFLLMLLFGGLIIPQSSLPAWLKWVFWLSPVTYVQIAVSVNEFLSPRWQKISSSNTTIGDEVLTIYNLSYSRNFYWISVGALVGFWMIFNFGFTFALSFFKPPGRSYAIISHEKFLHLEGRVLPNNDTHTANPDSEDIGEILCKRLTIYLFTVLGFKGNLSILQE